MAQGAGEAECTVLLELGGHGARLAQEISV